MVETRDAGRRRLSNLRRVAIAVTAVLATVGALLQPLSAPPEAAEAASASDFQPGSIIADELFFNGQAMNASAVQSFLSTTNGTCAAGYTCIDEYQQATPSMPADAYCDAIGGRSSETAASIIARIGAACDISQRTLLVLLQKEQSLVTDTSPSSRQYSRATGFACPDTAPCDSSFGGFFYQVYYAARQFQRYAAHPTSYNHVAGRWNNVLYHPNSACGSSRVYIQNAATAALYNYTPYQPNAAALANLYGTGDNCSAYGNRNFWRMWTDWFGSTQATMPHLVHQEGYSYIYVVAGGQRYRVHDDAMLQQLRPLGEPVAVSASVLQSTPLSSIPMQRVVRNASGQLYYINDGGILRIPDCAHAQAYGQSCTNVPTLETRQVGAFADRGWLRRIAKMPDGTMWFMSGGQRRQVLDPTILAAYGVPSLTSSLTEHAISFAPVGVPVVGSGTYWSSNGSYPRLVTNAGRFGLSGSQAQLGFMQRSGVLQPASLSALPTSGSVQTRMRVGSQGYLLVDEGWLRVSAAQYGGTGVFVSRAAGAESGLPVVRPATPQHFVRERGSTQVWLISGGYRRPVSSAEMRAISSTYGVSSRVWQTAAGGLEGVRKRPPALSSSLVRASNGSQTYLAQGANLYPVSGSAMLRVLEPLGTVQVVSPETIASFTVRSDQPVGRIVRGSDGVHWFLDSGGSRYRLGSCATAEIYGATCASVPALSSQQIGAFTDRGSMQRIVRLPDASLWFIQSGDRRQVLDPRILAPWGVPSTTTSLQTGALDGLTVGVPVVASGTYWTSNGSYPRLVSSAGRFGFSGLQAQLAFMQRSGVLQAASLRALPTSGAVSTRMRVGTQGYLLVDEGWLQVSAAQYGGTGVFDSRRAGVETGLPVVRPATPQHFVRERGSSQVWLISGGYRRAVSSAEMRSISSTYGVSSRVWQTASGGLQGVPTR